MYPFSTELLPPPSRSIINKTKQTKKHCFTPTVILRTIRDGEQPLRDVQFGVSLRPQRPYELLGTGSPGRPPRLTLSDSLS